MLIQNSLKWLENKDFFWPTVFVIFKLLQELGIWLLCFLAKYGQMDNLYVFWILAVIITLTIGSLFLVLAYALIFLNLEDAMLTFIILDVLIEALLKPYFEDVTVYSLFAIIQSTFYRLI